SSLQCGTGRSERSLCLFPTHSHDLEDCFLSPNLRKQFICVDPVLRSAPIKIRYHRSAFHGTSIQLRFLADTEAAARSRHNPAALSMVSVRLESLYPRTT